MIHFVSESDGLFRVRVEMNDAIVMQEAAREIQQQQPTYEVVLES